ncbi:MAG: hypothetical protein U9O84_05130 [Chloroflexota bacterium]|nr:hypothetical protein [Chloroflexota bacterium]
MPIKAETPKAEGRIGFVACYRGKTIAMASSFDKLMEKPLVKERLGKKDLVIKHTVPEGIIAVY